MAEMNIIELGIDEIIPYENNPRRNEKAVDAVANSIKEFGFKNPIILDADKVIISGLSEEQVRAFRLADNRVASFAVWDEKKLKDEIANINDIDLSDFGFKKDTIDDIFKEKSGKKTHICPKCGHEWE